MKNLLSLAILNMALVTLFALPSQAMGQAKASNADTKLHLLHTLKKTQNVFSALKDEFVFSEEFSQFIADNAQFLSGHERTSLGSPLFFLKLGNWQDSELPLVFWVGGIHADEFAPSLATWRVLEDLFLGEIDLQNSRVLYIPFLNFDGFIDGYKRTGYPTRENAQGKDLNRSFYSTENLPRGQGPKEVEFVLELAEIYRPYYWVIPHAALGLIDLDSSNKELFKDWASEVAELTAGSPSPVLPYVDFPTYGNPNELTNWSIGRYISSTRFDGKELGGITFEFPGPGTKPDPNAPDYARQVSRRKHLGRYAANTYLAHEYYDSYKLALVKCLSP
jgi:hypothetical protein